MHPWIWLNEPQHSAAVQAITGIVATIAAVIAALYAAGAYDAAREQADHARTQAQSARDQLELQREQFADEKAAREEDNRRIKNEQARKALARHQEEVTVRPRFQIVDSWPQAYPSIVKFKNVGGMPANDLSLRTLWNNQKLTTGYFLPIGEALLLNTTEKMMKDSGFEVSFVTGFGTRWTLLYKLIEGEGLKEVDTHFEDLYT